MRRGNSQSNWSLTYSNQILTGKLPVMRYHGIGSVNLEDQMYVQGRQSNRHMKGKQVAMTVYLPPKKYWLLKWVSNRKGVSMQNLLRQALDQVLDDAAQLR